MKSVRCTMPSCRGWQDLDTDGLGRLVTLPCGECERRARANRAFAFEGKRLVPCAECGRWFALSKFSRPEGKYCLLCITAHRRRYEREYWSARTEQRAAKSARFYAQSEKRLAMLARQRQRYQEQGRPDRQAGRVSCGK